MADDKTFTQAEMDSIIEGRLARERQKYADYDDLKEKASKYDEYQAQNKTELQKEKEKSDALQAKLSALEKKDTVRQVREKTAKDTGVPVELLTGEDEETCKKQAEAIMKFAKPKSYPGTKGNRKKTTEYNTTDDAMREFAHQIFGKVEKRIWKHSLVQILKFRQRFRRGFYIATESRTRRRGRAEIANPNCICF